MFYLYAPNHISSHHKQKIQNMKFSGTLILILTLLPLIHFGQGCSDAGFCTINTLKPNSLNFSEQKNNIIRIGAFTGSADNEIMVWGSYLDYSRRLSKVFGVDFRITQLAQSGNNISSNGIADIFTNIKYRMSNALGVSAGLKIPLSDGNKSLDGLTLPMDYQSSLGTLDLILGLAYEIGDLGLSLGYQQPLSQNKNTFISGLYPENSPLRQFQTTNNYQRAADIMMRVYYPISISDKFNLTPGVLPIYHLDNDKYTDENGQEALIDGSKGLTVNANVHLDYRLSLESALQFNIGMPLVVRDARPDGLTRGFIATLEYRVNF